MDRIRRKKTPKKEFRGELDPSIEELEKLYGGKDDESKGSSNTFHSNHLCLRRAEI